MNTNWYAGNMGNDTQGLVCDENTGENIAVTYKAENAALVAAAPDLLAALEFLVAAADTEPGMNIYKAHIAAARAAIAKALNHD